MIFCSYIIVRLIKSNDFSQKMFICGAEGEVFILYGMVQLAQSMKGVWSPLKH